LVPDLDGPIYKGIFPDISLLLSAPNFPIMIDPAQIAWSEDEAMTKMISLLNYVRVFTLGIMNAEMKIISKCEGNQMSIRSV
jgi:hypothetical protein